MGLDIINGLPVHPLVVHAAIVLIPLSALGAIVMALWPRFSRRFGVLVVIVAFVAAGASVVAKESGEKLAALIGNPQVHANLGATMPIFAGGTFLAVLVLWLFDRGIPGDRSRPVWLTMWAVVVVIVSLTALWWTYRVGESGATAVWEPIMQKARVQP